MRIWKGRPPKITPELYELALARYAIRRGKNDTDEPTVADLAREHGVNPITLYSAVRQGIKRYEVDR